MRLMPFVLVLAACDGLGGNRTDPVGEGNCFDPSWIPLTESGMTFTQLTMDSSTFDATYEHGKSYPGRGIAGCYDPNSTAIRWVFEANGEPLGALRVLASATGNRDMQGTVDTLTLEFFGNGTTTAGGDTGPISYGTTDSTLVTNLDFLTGAWVVDGLNPFEMTFQGSTQGATTLNVNLAAAGTR